MISQCLPMPEEKKRSGHKLSAWISDSLYDDLKNFGYFGISISQTETITRALELLLKKSKTEERGGQKGENWEIQGDSNDYMGDIEGLGELRAHVGDLQELIKEKDRHIDTLKAELEKAERDKEDLKTTYNKLQDTYNNYMAQMQTLIKQKSIEAPGANKPWWRFW
jgi:predicted RNase H-like nuclease (RuvC/YqgF family)